MQNITIIIGVLTHSKQGTGKFSRKSQCGLLRCKAKQTVKFFQNIMTLDFFQDVASKT